MKNARQEAILEIVSKEDINTQEQLLLRLSEAGFCATQATVSRDIRELKLVKAMTSKGNYRYERSEKSEESPLSFSSALSGSITRLNVGCNIVVIHTYSGMANAVAVCLDSMKLPDVLGCVAGDDTIIVVSSTPEAAENLADNLRQTIRAL